MIDDHCHPFSLEGGHLDLSAMTLDAHPGAESQLRRGRTAAWRVNQELLASRLAKRLGCAVEDLESARAEASRDWAGYVQSLLDDAGLEELVMDAYYPRGAERNMAQMSLLAGRRIHTVMRLDHVIDDLIDSGSSAKEILDSVQASMQLAAREGVVAFKSIVAYRTGLAVSATVSPDEAEDSLREVAPLRRRAKACRDWLLRLCLATASDLGKPFQIHSGLGDSDLRLSEANPLLLEELLRTPEASATKILIMVAYPWHEELAYMVTTKPNVWADLSMFNLYAPMTFADRLLRTLDMAPATKLLLGSDGYNEPEIFWFGAMTLREAWKTTSRALASAGARSAWLKDVEKMIFAENARSLYGLSIES